MTCILSIQGGEAGGDFGVYFYVLCRRGFRAGLMSCVNVSNRCSGKTETEAQRPCDEILHNE